MPITLIWSKVASLRSHVARVEEAHPDPVFSAPAILLGSWKISQEEVCWNFPDLPSAQPHHAIFSKKTVRSSFFFCSLRHINGVSLFLESLHRGWGPAVPLWVPHSQWGGIFPSYKQESLSSPANALRSALECISCPSSQLATILALFKGSYFCLFSFMASFLEARNFNSTSYLNMW